MSRHTLSPRALLALVLVVAGCSGPVLANPPAQQPIAVPSVAPSPSPVADPVRLEFPRDDGPHSRLTEWWYYTGHLTDDRGGRWGFEFVIFRGERGRFPVFWASHLALTDEAGKRFLYAQRAEIGGQVDRSVPGAGFDFAITSPPHEPWRMAGSDGRDHLIAEAAAAEVTGSGKGTSFAIDLALAPRKPPALHDHDGWVDFGPGAASYYYSRTRLAASGSLEVDGRSMKVDGIAWFDHQWGDFIAVGRGWDWFAVSLADGTDVTLSVVRGAPGLGGPIVYGTLVRADGTTRHLDSTAFNVVTTGQSQSATTGIDYPAGWRIAIPGERLVIDLAPTVPEQELDTRATSGVTYWEGSQRVVATRDGRRVAGEAYVELTGYGPPR